MNNSCHMGIHMPMWSVASDLESLTNFQLILGNRLSHLDEGDAGLWVSHSSDKFWDCPLGRLGLPSGDLTNTVFFFFFLLLLLYSKNWVSLESQQSNRCLLDTNSICSYVMYDMSSALGKTVEFHINTKMRYERHGLKAENHSMVQ